MTRRNGTPNGTQTNGSNGKNGKNGNQPPSMMVLSNPSEMVEAGDKSADSQLVRAEAFDQPVILQQTNFWSRAIVWGIVGVATFVTVWASVAKIEEAVPAVGQLKPQGQVQPIQAPVGGVVQTIYVKNGQHVKQGDVLIRFDPTATEAQRRSLDQVRTTLMRENQFYRSLFAGGTAQPDASLRLPPEILALTTNRVALESENRLFRAQLNGSPAGLALTAEELDRIQSGLSDSTARAAAAQFEVAQLQQQLRQTQSELASAQQSLAIDQDIYDRLEFLAEEGGISQLQFLRQQQQVLESQGQVTKLSQEQQRIQYGISQAQERLQSTVATSRTDWLNRVAENEKQIASIDSQLNKTIIENEKRIAEIASQISQADLNLKYQELRAPVDGIVFDLQAKGPGFVANNTEPILQIVPGDALVAEVYVTNKDIGFVREGMPVDIRVDSFPFSEFGDIKGELTTIGSDALPPDQEHPFYRFPVKVEMDRQVLEVEGKEIPLQSGMSINANIITRNRTVMSIFIDQFTRTIESIETVR